MTAASHAGHTPAYEPVDLTNCDVEPIHVPGAIQPHGVLLAMEWLLNSPPRWLPPLPTSWLGGGK